jgi:hypothetical protein
MEDKRLLSGVPSRCKSRLGPPYAPGGRGGEGRGLGVDRVNWFVDASKEEIESLM